MIPAAPSEIDGEVWTVPAARMKGDKGKVKNFDVPLSAAALAIVERMQAEHGAGGFLFPGGKRGQHLSNMAMLKLLPRCGRGDLTVHGFRATFKTWASNETDSNFAREVVEAAMAHAIDSKVEEAYQRGDFFKKRRQLMEAWAHFATSTSTSATSAAAAKAVPMQATG